MKYFFQMLLVFFCLFSTPGLCGDTHKDLDLKAIEFNIANHHLKSLKNQTLKDSILQTKSSGFGFKNKKKRTLAHKFGLISYLSLWSSYVVFIVGFILTISSVAGVESLILSLGFLFGIFGFLLAILSLLLYFGEKNKKGLGLPIMSILMVIFPIIGILYTLNKIGGDR